MQNSPAFLQTISTFGRRCTGKMQRNLVCCQSAPNVHFRGRTIKARPNEKLRDVLMRADQEYLSPHNGGAKLINCRGLGTCGTCAVEIFNGSVEPPALSVTERFRLSLPPHDLTQSQKKNLRLACQVRVHNDIFVRKYDKFWGQGEDEQPYNFD